MKSVVRLSALMLIVLAVAANATATEDLTSRLHAFLAGVGEAEIHDQFWADDLIYTSSRGTRTNKAEIMANFSTSNEDDSVDTEPVYTAEEIQIQMHGTTAVLAFKLVATPSDDSGVQHYFNTGTFVKRDGRWQVVAWQATKIP